MSPRHTRALLGHWVWVVWLALLSGCQSSSSPQAVEPSDSESGEPVPTVSATPLAASAFNVQLRYFDDSLTPERQAVLLEAAKRWMSAIVADIPDQPLDLAAGECSDAPPAFNGTVDDVLIDVYAVEIDGEGGTLGQAGPCIVRADSFLPVYGIVEFDRADLDRLDSQPGALFAVALHEMAHVLGFGTIWNSLSLLDPGVAVGLNDPQFLGSNASRAYAALGSEGTVPVENIGGSGSSNSHWRESVFDTEIMTSKISTQDNPLSALTLSHFADLGYQVDTSVADPYVLPASPPDPAAASLGSERILLPRRFVRRQN